VKLAMYQKIRLQDGRLGFIIEIFKDGEAYMVDVPLGDGEYDEVTISPSDIKSIVVEVDEPFVMTV